MNLVNTIKDLIFAGNTTNDVAAQLGASETNVRSGIGALVPVILSGLINRGNSTGGGIMDIITQAGPILGGNNDVNLGGILGNVLGGNHSNSNVLTNILGGLFGNRVDNITNGVSTHSGLKQSSVLALLTSLAPLIIGQIRKYFSNNNINTEPDAVRFMNTQKDYVAAAMPAGLSLGSLFGNIDDNIRTTHKTTTHEPVRHSHPEPERKKSGMGWLWLLLLAGLGFLLYSMLGDGCKKTEETTVVHVDTPATTTVTTQPSTTTRTLTEVTTASGVKLQAYPGGVEDQLIKFIGSDGYKTADEAKLKETWFDFDDLNFEFGTSKITADSKRQLDNIVAILKAYPDAKIKIGAYTDKVGDDAGNLKLSQQRAEAVKAALTAAGVGAQVTGAEGYGEQFAKVAETASDEERKSDRRTAIRMAK